MAESRRPPDNNEPRADGARFVIVEARFYDDIGALLLAGATRAFDSAGAVYEIVTVPGALEVPVALAIALDSTTQAPFDGAIALGCILRGETYHFEVVSNESARALMDVAVARKLPFGNGILTVETERQAIARADPAQGDKGGDAARAALALYRIKAKGRAA